jgi:hypothetical protein
MDQKAYLAITAMLNAFPQGSGNPDLTLRTYEAVLRDVTPAAVIEAAQRFTGGDVPGQSKTFAPSTAEFTQEAKRIASLLPYRNRPALPAPSADTWRPHPKEDRVRMGFKMSVLSAGIGLGRVDDVAKANDSGLEDLIALGQKWGVPVPEELWQQVNKAA